ncbi:hypothetical protein Tcan_05977 [Toxocara canis]|uniref:Proline-rich protein PRCC n=1 Tax=Toxocara canis TaxID=6265 RepID=A0A0B2VIU7_TOXCA|nr:hypothetical protein Tcan_05977 [Toxocara canis]
MLSLVDYGESDSDGQSEHSDNEGFVYAEVITNPKKGLSVTTGMNRDEDDYFGAKANTEKIDSDAGGSETIPSGDGFGILTSLPLGTTTSTKSKRNEKIGDDELEELVRRKQWEIKLAKKIERKRRRIEKKAKKEAKKLLFFQGLGDGFGILTSLPLGTTTSTKSKRNEKIGDDELEELVRRKQWEIKLAKKIERKRRRIEKKAKKEAKKLKKAAANDSAGIAKKKKTKIDAFGGLVGLTYDSDDESDDKKEKVKTPAKIASSGLLSVLPLPKTDARNESKGANILLPTSLRASKQRTLQEVPKKNAVIVEEGSDESDVGSSDFFGLRSTSEVPQPPIDHVLPTVMSDISYGPTRPPIRLNQDPAFDYTNASVEILPSKAEGPSTSGIIDNAEAQRMIYSHDVATWGGTEASAAAAVDSIVDVSVDQALGPNVQANLLKNLHNKSLAEATLSHLAAVPKAKKPADMIARRKHQITYLATVAVAREEQLAEQWSQNRHMKRVSAQKYGF